MGHSHQRFMAAVATATTLLVQPLAAYAQQGENLREAAQNPIGDLISLPFQNNTNFDIGHTDNTQNILNIQPVYPIHLNQKWNLILTRPILPVIYQPPFFSGIELQALEGIAGPDIGDTEFGLGDLTPELFFSPKKPIQLAPGRSLVWGVGPAFQLPTATDEVLGTGKWSAGPGFVVFLSDEPLHITTGFLILNLWSFAGQRERWRLYRRQSVQGNEVSQFDDLMRQLMPVARDSIARKRNECSHRASAQASTETTSTKVEGQTPMTKDSNDIYARRRAIQAQAKGHAHWYEGLHPRAASNLPSRARDQQRSQTQRRRDDDEASGR